MNIFDYVDSIEATIICRRYPNQNDRHCVRFEYCEVMDGQHGLLSSHGNAKNFHDALNDYINQIRGRRIVFNAMSKGMRKEFTVPNTLKTICITIS